jgi:hypothetical protein
MHGETCCYQSTPFLSSPPSRLVIFLRILPFLLRTEVGTKAQLDRASLLLMLFILEIDLLANTRVICVLVVWICDE